MAERQPRTVVTRLGSLSLVISGVLFLLFVADVLLGKAAVVFGWQVSIGLTDVGEYLVLLFTALFFTVATLLREYRENQSRDEGSPVDPVQTAHQSPAVIEEKIRNDR